jgi:internalin A
VRRALEDDERNHISAEEFFRICAANGFAAEEDMRQLGGYLHDLGVCLYFQDDPVLSHTVILKPEWGTTAVYRVLDDRQIIESRGVFDLADLRRIWHEPTYQVMRGQLLRLMERFSLCFTMPGTTTYVAPQLLSGQPAQYDWDEPGGLTLRFDYDVMPKGIVQRLIVALHRLIDGNAVWRNGVVLRYDTGRAEVIEDYHRRRLRIRLGRRDPKMMLSIIDLALDTIHESYPDLRLEKFRQCDCEACASSEEPTMFPVRELKDFARTGDLIQCRVSRRLMDPAVLLNELWKPDDQAVEVSHPLGPAEAYVSGRSIDEIEQFLNQRGLLLDHRRDKLRPHDAIQRFLRRLGSAKIVVVVIDDAYLRSDTDMFELMEIAERQDLVEGVFAVVRADADIFEPLGRLRYARYWEAKREELRQAAEGLGPDLRGSIDEDLDRLGRFTATAVRIADILAGIPTLTPEMHRDTDFEQLYRWIDAAVPPPEVIDP